MLSKNTIKIGTHDGKFHADEVLAIAILSKIFPDHHIVRSRDPDILIEMDILVDVGGVYDHDHRYYDHHMPDPPKDKVGHIYSSAGLIWKHYAKTYLKKIQIPDNYVFKGEALDVLSAVEKQIRTHWIYPIDRNDNGTNQGPTPISDVIQVMRPIDAQRYRKTYDELFMDAVSMVSHLFYRACFHTCDYVIQKFEANLCDKVYEEEGKILISSLHIPDHKIYQSSEVHFIISPVQDYVDSDIYYAIRPIFESMDKKYKTPFPEKLLGHKSSFIKSQTGLKGIRFIHHQGFLAFCETQEDALIFCKYLLAIKENNELQ